ncbi:efflux RND transporter periplasmic adaptor subunit [Pelomonas aquatica]|jgi:RND family efflux transporter MFP subunit|uniref:Efflux RND transporter periplasmic adaptor subunit n=1 Tax=Pelomonas aquatica TaxID=431058 RepID=A0A9X4R4F3_9BURK|nr:efflux RND transporter periplasmic adaptor subunit [Pelomonas aquatica]MCY4752966.1 efflux RND transporter periplasmic adaptor subunit [Pelomonas aquatica]MDG0862094.1 efflux RND transporter periplasmic adaptor subunit [Pelomonas aquatica]
MTKNSLALPLTSLLAVLLAACGQQQGGPGGHAGGPPPVSVAPATQREVQEFDEFTARLEAPDTVDVRARVAGTVEAVRFKEGQLVRKGEPLFSIDARAFKADVARAEAQVAALKTQVELARADLARAEKLVSVNAVSAQEIDQLRAALRSAEANLKAAEATLVQSRLNVEYANITAPVSGRTSRANVTPGNLVGVGDPVLTTLVSSDKVYAYFDASEATYLRYMRAAREGKTVARDAVAVQMGLSNEDGYPHTGRLDFVDNHLNPATASIRVRAVFDNKGGQFTPGLYARIKLGGSASYNGVVVPDRAITTDQTRKIVLVVGPNNIVQPRPVTPGALVDGMRVVGGVKAGELVIVDGLLRAFPGAPVTPQVLKVDNLGMPIPGAPPGAAPAAPASAASK